VPGVLFIYNRPTLPWAVTDASNVDENVAAFGRHSSLPLWGVNTDLGFPPRLAELDFDAVVLHYTVFVWGGLGPVGYLLDEGYLDFLSRSEAYKVAFFQDEFHWCKRRFGFLNDFRFDCVYTMLEQPHADQVYRTHTNVSTVVPNLPSYVGPELLQAADRFAKPDQRRGIDISYRGPSPLPAYMGRGAVEKVEIGERFAELARDSGLRLDIACSAKERIYGDDWHRFTADSRGTLGSESGVSCFDLEDEVRLEYERLSADGHEPTLEELEAGALGRWDWNIPYRTISPRNFEAAAFGVAQIMFEGDYSGVIQPMRHYIPLKKDFSNFDEVIARFRDAELRRELTENAHRDLIASGDYSYERFFAGFDRTLVEAGVRSDVSPSLRKNVDRAVRQTLRERWQRYRSTRLNWLWVEHRRWFRVFWTLDRVIGFPYRLASGLFARGR
jgi:hypothetical protein